MICPLIYGRLAGRVCIDPNCTTSSSHKDRMMSDVPLIRFIDGTEPYIEALSWTCCSYSTQRYTLFHCKFLPEYLTNARQSNMTITITQSVKIYDPCGPLSTTWGFNKQPLKLSIKTYNPVTFSDHMGLTQMHKVAHISRALHGGPQCSSR